MVLVAGRAVGLGARTGRCSTGVLIGLGTATKLYPLFLLGGLLVICLRDRRLARLRRSPRSAAARAWVRGQRCRRTSPAASSGRCSGRSTPSAAPTSARSGWSSARPPTHGVHRAHDQRLVVGVLRRSGASACWSLGLRAPDDAAAGAARLPGRGRLPAGQQGLLAAVRPVAAAAGRAGPAALARPADLAGRRGPLLRRGVVVPRRRPRSPAAASDAGFYWLAIVRPDARPSSTSCAIVARDIWWPAARPGARPREVPTADRQRSTRSNVVAV